MIKNISKPVVSFMKWGAVAGAITLGAATIQANADSVQNSAIGGGALNLSNANTTNLNQNWSPSLGFADLIERVSPAVVHVGTSGFVSARSRPDFPGQFNFPPGFGFEDMFPDSQKPQQGGPGETQEKRPLGIGSGFIISSDGYVVTNHHVIEKADEIIVTLTNGVEYEAEIKGSDVKTDVALLKLKGAKDLPVVAWGDDEKSRVGDWVLAIGNPFGLGGSASTGIISARGRDINSGPYDDFIQVDAAINRGNSGGPLFNIRGEVIGINTAIFSPTGGSVGIGFSIPSNQAKNVIEQLERTGTVERAWIGVAIQPLDDELAQGFGRSDKNGALISSVQPGAPADKAGIRPGDIVLSYDGEEIKEMRDLPKTVALSSVGERHRVVVWRDNKKETISITTESFPVDPKLVSSSPLKSDPVPIDVEESIGAQLQVLTNAERTKYKIDDAVLGVLVISVVQNGLADKNGLRTGDVISAINNVRVTTPNAIAAVVNDAKKSGQSTIPILLTRANGARFLPFKLK